MRTNRTMLVALALLLTATATFGANPLMGTWKLNEGKSKFAPGATKNTTVTYAPAKGDMIKCTVDGVDKDGKPIHWIWVGKFDDKPYVREREDANLAALRQTTFGLSIDALAGA